MIILIGRKPARATYAKVKDHDKVTASVRHNPLGASKAIKEPPIQSICKSKTRNKGNSKFLGRIAVTVFNVPFPNIYHFPNFLKFVEPYHWRVTTQFIKFEPVPIYLELSFILFVKFLLFFMTILEAKKKSKYKTFFYIFWKVWTTNTLSLNSLVGEAYISIRLENGYIP